MKDEKLRRPAKAGFFYIATSIAAKAVSFLATPLFTRLLSPEDYGLYQLYMSWLGILTVILSLGISGGAIYRAIGKFESCDKELISESLIILSVPHIAALIISAVFIPRIEASTGLPAYIWLLLIFELYLNASQLVIFAKERYKYAYQKVCIINLAYAVLSPLLSLLLIYATPLKREARIIASFVTFAVLMVPEIIRHIIPRATFRSDIIKYLLRLSLPLLPHALFMALIAGADKLMIEKMSGVGELAKYSVAYSAGFILTALTNAIYSAVQPWLMRKLNSGNTDEARIFMSRLLMLTASGLSLFLFFTPEVFSLIAGPEYRDAEAAVYPLAVAGVLQFTANILASNIIHSEKTASLSLASFAAFALNLGLNLFLIPRFGYTAAALTTALAYAVLIVLEYTFLKRRREDALIDKASFLPFLLTLFPILFRAFGAPLSARALFALACVLIAAPTVFRTFKMVRA